jgi:PAS domain-containing protein
MLIPVQAGRRMRIYATDITERKQAEEALAASREFLSAVLENVGVGISLLDPEMRLLQINRKMREWFPKIAVDEHPVCYQAYNDPPREAPCSYCPCVLTWQDGQVHEAVIDTPSPEGTRHYRIVASPIRNTAGKIIAVIEMVDDITERIETEKALRESEERLQLKLDSVLSPDVDLGEQELANIIDSSAIQSLMDDFYAVSGMGIGIIDLRGNVLVATGWQEICTKFHRVHPGAQQNCFESDLKLTQGVPPGEFRAYKCKNNLWDLVTPIFLGGKHVGNIFIGQFYW